jgi:hypothetical protein
MKRLVVVAAAVAALARLTAFEGPSQTAATGVSAAAPGGVRATAAMGQARAAHTATTLANGNILIAGGFTGDESQVAGAELFDRGTERFRPAGRAAVLRQSHSATRLPDGTVLLAGGMGGSGEYHDTAELYDPSAGTFRMTGRMLAARSNHEAVLLADGRVLLVGGVGTGWTFLASAEIYDPRTGRFAAAGAMQEPRESHVAVRLRDGRVLVAGGHRGRGNATVISRTAEIYDVASRRFTPAAAMGIRRHKHDAVALEDGRVLVLGGADERDNEGVYSSVEIFDPAAGEFRAGGPMRLGRYKHRGTSLPLGEGRWLLAGGAPSVEVYDAATGASDLVPGDSPLAGQFSSAASLGGGRVLITGGYGQGRGPRSNAWIFAPSGGKGPFGVPAR